VQIRVDVAPINYMCSAAAVTALTLTDLHRLRFSNLGHAAGGPVVLLWAMSLEMYKPNAATRFGWSGRAWGAHSSIDT
jgi:hypothetical protein